MAPIWKPKDPDLLKSWVESVMKEASDELSDWESRFINDMHERLEKGYVLTEYQENKLEEIYAEKTS